MNVRSASLLVLLLTLAACLPRPPLRGVGAADPIDLENIAGLSEAYCRVQDKSVEPHPGFRLAFIELHESGLARAEQVDYAIESIRQSGEKIAIVLFVHGWGHSADALDENVVGFRAALADLRAVLPADRSIVGVYVGWPAMRFRKPFHYLTFMGRDDAANEVSTTCAAKEVLEKLQSTVEELRFAGRDVVSVAVGHSLGGKFLFTPMQERLERLDSRISEEFPVEKLPFEELPDFGDLVLLLNPAQDINDYKVFEKYSKSYSSRYPGHHRPVVMIMSSEADGTIRSFFKVGRTFKTLQYTSRWGRDFWKETIGLGWEREQITHALCLPDHAAPTGAICNADHQPIASLITRCGETELRRHKENGPIWLVRVDGRIVKSHGDVFNCTFLSFLRAFVAQQVQGPNVTAGAACSDIGDGLCSEPLTQRDEPRKQRFRQRDCDRSN